MSIREFAAKAYNFLFRKRCAYRTVFDIKGKAARIVLADLRRHCPADPTKGAGSPIDEKQVYINIGKRQILGHIIGMINLPDEKLEEIAMGEYEENGNWQ